LRVESVVVMMRHGVRPPTKNPAMPKGVAAQDWPRWDVPPGWLTAHGGRAIEVLGRGDAAWLKIRDCAHVRIIADSDQRTIATAQHWAKGAMSSIPACTPAIDHLPQDQEDPRFNALSSGLARLDPAAADRGVAQEVGPGGLPAMDARMKALYARLDAVLCGERVGGDARADCGVGGVPSALRPATETAKPKLSGALDRASTAAQVMLLEYADGKAMGDVGWGRASAADIAAFSTFHAEEFRLLARPRDLALPNLAGLMPAIREGLAGRGVTLIAGHDTNVANLGGVLRLHWHVPGFAADDPAPGGAIVLEVLRGAGAQRFVRATYRAQTLDDIRRGGTRITRQPMRIEGCGDLCPMTKVEALLTR
jgi:4-phytase/acid phosphatase